MTTPQEPARRLKQKRRREKQLAKWRDSHPTKAAAPAPTPAKGAGRAGKA